MGEGQWNNANYWVMTPHAVTIKTDIYFNVWIGCYAGVEMYLLGFV